MSTHFSPRTSELLADKALFGLAEDERRELDTLLAAEGVADDGSFEIAASAVELALTPFDPQEALPEHLAAKVLARGLDGARPANLPRSTVKMATTESAASGFATAATVRAPVSAFPAAMPTVPLPAAPTPAAPTPPAPAAEVVRLDDARPTPPRSRLPLVVGWLAAAACFALAAAGWWPQLRPDAPVELLESALSVPELQLPDKTAAERRDELLAAGKSVVTIPWTATGDPASEKTKGDVVWSNETQEGYMRFSAFPSEYQYQLWIFDASKDERYPVDGGVFDVDPETGDTIVPISAKIRVGEPTLFAVTIEKPGGVVVSKRERIVVTAKVGT